MGKELPVIWDDSDVTWIFGAFFFPPSVGGTQCPEEPLEDCSWLGARGGLQNSPGLSITAVCSDTAVLSEGLPFAFYGMGFYLVFLERPVNMHTKPQRLF